MYTRAHTHIRMPALTQGWVQALPRLIVHLPCILFCLQLRLQCGVVSLKALHVLGVGGLRQAPLLLPGALGVAQALPLDQQRAAAVARALRDDAVHLPRGSAVRCGEGPASQKG